MNNLTNKTVSFFVNSSQVKKPTLNCFLDFYAYIIHKSKSARDEKEKFHSRKYVRY